MRLTVECESLRDHGAVLVRVAGPLTSGNRHVLWVAVRKIISDCPEAVIVDVAGVSLVDQPAAAVLIGLRRSGVNRDPEVPVLWCGATGFLADRLRRLDHNRPLYSTPAEAIQAISSGPSGERWLFHRLEPAAGAVHMAGVLIADACSLWHVPELIHPSRRVVFDMVRRALWCPPRELHLTAFRRESELLVSVRSLIDGDHATWCSDQTRGARGHHFKRTALGHIGWAWLPLAVT
jgi:hypothetical protein